MKLLIAIKPMTVEAENILPIWLIREICAEVAGKPIDKGTFSRWCSRFSVSGTSTNEIPIDIASGLITLAMFHYVGVRKIKPDAYNRLYPLTHMRMLELYGKRRDHDNQWRSADPPSGSSEGSASGVETCAAGIGDISQCPG